MSPSLSCPSSIEYQDSPASSAAGVRILPALASSVAVKFGGRRREDCELNGSAMIDLSVARGALLHVVPLPLCGTPCLLHGLAVLLGLV